MTAPVHAPGRIDATSALDGVALVLTIANPGRANALDESILTALPGALATASDHGVRVVLLTGAGTTFSSGVALDPGPPATRIGELRGRERLLMDAVSAVETCERPVIAVMNGAAMGGALELAVACDWRIAADGARFGMPPARLGVVYSGAGLSRFVALLGAARTREIFLTGTTIDAARAAEIGLVNSVHERDALWGAALEQAAAVAALAPTAIAGTRAIIRSITLAADARVAHEWRERAYAHDDLVEGLTAFAERREPRFGQ
ncbi:MAG: enoyl-CoA hydratase/isomerase family protein [Actinobacteria bacterium]|nr:enoyl-CoA hydratase/isomerase family protein [Actinomycetota bacterium]